MRFYQILLVLILVALIACTSALPTPLPSPTTAPAPIATWTSSPTNTPTQIPPVATATRTLVPATATPQPNIELRFFYDWNPQDPFNLQGTGLNSKRDAGEPPLPVLAFSLAGQDYTADGDGVARFLLPVSTITTTITIPNTNKSVSPKNLAALGIQFTMTMYEPNRVNYGPRFLIDFRDDNCQQSSGKITCNIGLADGCITSPFKGENYLYSSPWTFDSGLDLNKDFVTALNNGRVPSPASGMYQIGELGKLIASYANNSNRGVPYGYPYLVNDPKLGIVSHLLMDVRNDVGVPIYAPVGGTICKGNSSDFAICAVDVTIDINDIRAIPNWDYELQVTRGQLIGWTDPVRNITGQTKPFPLIHMGHFEHRDRAMTLAHFPYFTPEQIVMGAKPNTQGQIYLASREQVISDYDWQVHLPHAPVYIEK